VYDPNTKTYRGTVKIKATRDFIDDKNRNHELIFRPIFDINQPMWMEYNISHVQVSNEYNNPPCVCVCKTNTAY